MLPLIKGFIPNSLIEWEGKISAVIFLAGCNLRCQYCHARALVLENSTLESIPFEAVCASIVESAGWLDGVVVSGGEPTISEGLEALLENLRRLGVSIKLDTNGTNPRVLERLLRRGLVDYVAMDIKAPLDERYDKIAGTEVNIEDIRRSIQLVTTGPHDYEFRTTVCPGLLSKADVVEIASSIRGSRRYVLQQFRPTNPLNRDLERVEPYAPEVLLEFANSARLYVQECFVRGFESPTRHAFGAGAQAFSIP